MAKKRKTTGQKVPKLPSTIEELIRDSDVPSAWRRANGRKYRETDSCVNDLRRFALVVLHDYFKGAEAPAKPLSEAEEMLLEAYVGTLGGSARAHERFDYICDFLEGATKAAKAMVKIKSKSSQRV